MAAGIKRKLTAAHERITTQIREGIEQDSPFSAGLAWEGFSGGYLAALEDVSLLLNGINPDRNGWWDELKS